MSETSIENWENKAKQGMLYGDAAMRDLSMDIQSIYSKLMRQTGLSYEDLKEMGISYLFIAHDLSMVKHISDRIGVMYLGNLVEVGDSDSVYTDPLHPYTRALLSAVPIPDPETARSRQRVILQGELPSPINPPSGCVFRTRCPKATERCAKEKPELKQVKDRLVACFLYEDNKE